MRVNPISEQDAEAQSNSLWPDGLYDFEIKDAEETTSAAGNDMIRLEVWVFNKDGGRRMLFDYLLDSVPWKLRHFAESCGLLAAYEAGDLIANEIVGRTGKCKVGTQAAKDQFPAKNTIRDYIKSADAKQPSEPRSTAVRATVASLRAKVPAGDLDDEIPF